jgi:undecaprenyl-diphosphatase
MDNIRNVLALISGERHQRLPYFLTAFIALIVFVLGMKLFVELTRTLETETLAYYDQLVTNYTLSQRNPMLTKYFKLVSDTGDVTGYLIVIILIAIVSTLIFKKWKFILQITSVLVLAFLSNTVLKKLINRARPGIEHLVTVKTLSYPSGHAMSSMAFYGLLIYLVYKSKLKAFMKTALISVLVLLILSIGISRIYLGVHFPSDVVGGFIAGFIWVVLCIFIFNLFEAFRKDSKTGKI